MSFSDIQNIPVVATVPVRTGGAVQPRRMLVLGDGASIHTERWIGGLAATGLWTIDLISMNPAPVRDSIRQIPGVREVLQIAPKSIAEAGSNYHYLLNIPRLRREARRLNPDVVNSLYLTSYGVIGALIKGRARLVHYVMGDDIMIAPRRSPIHRWVSRWALSRAQLIISSSRTMTKLMGEKLGVNLKRVITQQYGVAARLLTINGGAKEFDFISNRAWVANSNIDFLMKVLGGIEGANVALVGGQVPGSEALASKIEKLASACSRMTRLGSLCHEDNLQAVAKSRFLVSLTTSEGASLSVMEAMALGCIPILSDTEPNREWIEPGYNGFLAPVGDLEKSREIFRQAMALPIEKYIEMIAINREIIRERAVFETNMARVSEAAHGLIASANVALVN